MSNVKPFPVSNPSAEPAADLMQQIFSVARSRRPIDPERSSITSIQSAVYHLREQTRLTREQFAFRVGMTNSRLNYVETQGGVTLEELAGLITVANEYFLPNLARFFEVAQGEITHPPLGAKRKRRNRHYDY